MTTDAREPVDESRPKVTPMDTTREPAPVQVTGLPGDYGIEASSTVSSWIPEPDTTREALALRLCGDDGAIDLNALNALRPTPYTGAPFTCTGSFTTNSQFVRCSSPFHAREALWATLDEEFGGTIHADVQALIDFEVAAGVAEVERRLKDEATVVRVRNAMYEAYAQDGHISIDRMARAGLAALASIDGAP